MLAPLSAGAAQRQHTVLQINRQPGAGAGPTMTLPNAKPVALAVHQTVPDGARIDVPARITVVIASTDAKSTTTLRPDTSFTPVSTGAGEQSSIGHGSALFSVVHGALDFFQVKSDKFTASAKGTIFSVDTSKAQVSFACTRGAIDVAHDAKLQIDSNKRNANAKNRTGGAAKRSAGASGSVSAPTTVRTIDVLNAGAKWNVAYHPLVASDYVRKFASAAEAQAFYQTQVAAAQQSQDPERIAAAYNNRGNALYAEADYDHAIADYDEAIKLDHNLATAYYNRGNVYYDKGDLTRAIADYNEAIRIDPNYEYAYVDRGNAYDDNGDHARALADYNFAARLNPNDSDVYYNRGLLYDDQQDYDRALADYSQALKIDPTYSWAVSNRGLVYAMKGDRVHAMADYNEALRLDPKDADAYYNRGQAYASVADYDHAIADFTQATLYSPKDPDAHTNRALAYWAKGDYDRAIADDTDAIRLAPKDEAAYRGRGFAYWSKGDNDHALADYNQAIVMVPKDAFAYKIRGIVYLYGGSAAQAQSDFGNAAQLVPSDPYAALLLELANRRASAPSRLAQSLKAINMNLWPAPLIRLFLGQATPAAARAAAANPNATTAHAQLCEATFYSAEYSYLQNAKPDAMQQYRQVVSDCPRSISALAAAAALRAYK